MYRTDFWTLWEKVRVGYFKRTACILSKVKQITSPGGMHETVLGPGALGRPRGIGWRGRWEGGSGWGTHVNSWLIHVSVWQNPLKCREVISLQLIKINEKLKKESSPTPQFEIINSSALSLLYDPTLTSIHDYWINHSFDYMDLCWQSDASAF